MAIVADNKLAVIVRATALQLLHRSTQTLKSSALEPYINHPKALLRLSATMIANLLPAPERITLLLPMLNDSLKAIRIAAARNLVGLTLSKQQQTDFDVVFKELMISLDVNSWRAEGRSNRAVMEVDDENWPEAEKTFQAVIKIDPYFESGYINLTELYRRQNKIDQELQTLNRALTLFPDSAQLQYALGLHFVRKKQYHKATLYFEQAVKLSPEIEQYAYTYILSLDGEGKTKEAMDKLRKIINRYGSAQQLNELGGYLYNKLQRP